MKFHATKKERDKWSVQIGHLFYTVASLTSMAANCPPKYGKFVGRICLCYRQTNEIQLFYIKNKLSPKLLSSTKMM